MVGAGEGWHCGGPHGDDLANGQWATHMEKGHAHSVQGKQTVWKSISAKQKKQQADPQPGCGQDPRPSQGL